MEGSVWELQHVPLFPLTHIQKASVCTRMVSYVAPTYYFFLIKSLLLLAIFYWIHGNRALRKNEVDLQL